MKTKVTTLFFCFVCLFTHANNITVSNISLENLNEPESWVQVEFDLSWENSWRLNAGPSNWDAAWVFVKYRVNNGSWEHAQLAQTDFVAASGSTIDVTTDGIGAFIYRDTEGSGDFNLTDLRLRWDYGSVNTNDILDIQVFALEMVHIPEGAFYVGGSTDDQDANLHEGGNTTISYQVISEDAITISNTSGNLFYSNTGVINPGDLLGPVPADFPKGFASFYVMKYEMSQGQWVGFFNTLSETQKTNLDIGQEGNTRNTVFWSGGTASATTSNPDRAINFINRMRALAYLDWAGLRPLTELEFEKACRGPIAPKPGEYAWGNSNIAASFYTYVNDGLPNAQIANMETSTGNASYASTISESGPVRNGIFAASAINKNREETGGSYYGVMELSGNLWEGVITLGFPEGRSYTGLHGDGIINPTGEATVSNWPISTDSGYGLKGGGYANPPSNLRVSNRRLTHLSVTASYSDVGARGGRSEE